MVGALDCKQVGRVVGSDEVRREGRGVSLSCLSGEVAREAAAGRREVKHGRKHLRVGTTPGTATRADVLRVIKDADAGVTDIEPWRIPSRPVAARDPRISRNRSPSR